MPRYRNDMLPHVMIPRDMMPHDMILYDQRTFRCLNPVIRIVQLHLYVLYVFCKMWCDVMWGNVVQYDVMWCHAMYVYVYIYMYRNIHIIIYLYVYSHVFVYVLVRTCDFLLLLWHQYSVLSDAPVSHFCQEDAVRLGCGSLEHI